MYLHSNRVRHLQRVMALLAARLAPDELRLELARPLAGLLDADFYASYVWDDNSARFTRGVLLNGRTTHCQLYEAHFQYADPVAPHLMKMRVPTRASDVISQRKLVATSSGK